MDGKIGLQRCFTISFSSVAYGGGVAIARSVVVADLLEVVWHVTACLGLGPDLRRRGVLAAQVSGLPGRDGSKPSSNAAARPIKPDFHCG